MDVAGRLEHNLSELQAAAEAARRLTGPLAAAGELLRDALLNGCRLLCCGNGGSACDAAHFTAEIAGRYALERPGFPAVDLTADHSILTALINDYDPAEVFARQVVAQGAAGDVLCVFSTSGESANVVRALEVGRSRGLRTLAFLGRGGGACLGLADVELVVPGADLPTARVQEVHLVLYHTLCEALDPVLAAAGR